MTYQSEVLADLPRVYWRLGELSGTAAADTSGNGYTGTYTNTPTLGATSLLASNPGNKAVSFNGASNEAVVANGVIGPTTLAAFTLECWFDIPASGVGQLCTVSDPAGSAADLIELWYDTGVVNFDFQGTGFYSPSATEAITGAHHLVGVYNGTDLRLYVDGVLADTQAFANVGALLTVSCAFAGANYPGTGTVGATGVLDEVAFYTTALSSVRVAAHHAAGSTTGGGGGGNPLLPTLTLTADLGGTTDLTEYGVEPAFNIQRGTTSPQQTGTVSDASTLSTLLDNISRDLDPNNASSPFTGLLRPKVGSVATATWDSVDHVLLTGRVDDWPQSYPSSGTEQYVELRATDLFNYLANTPINTIRPAEKTGARFQAVLDAIDYPGPTSIDPGMSAVCGQDLQTVAALGHLGDLAQVEYGETGIDADGTLYFRDRTSIATDTRSTIVQAEYVQEGGLNFIDITMGSPQIINHVTVTYGKDGKQLTVRDQPSIDDFDLQAASVSLPFQTFSQAKVYGLWLLFLYAQPRTTFTSVTFQPYNDPGDTFDLWADLLSRKEGDLVQITLDPLIAPGTVSGDPIVRQQWVRGINYGFDQDPAQITLTLQDTWIDGLFYWDTSDLDGPDFYGP